MNRLDYLPDEIIDNIYFILHKKKFKIVLSNIICQKTDYYTDYFTEFFNSPMTNDELFEINYFLDWRDFSYTCSISSHISSYYDEDEPFIDITFNKYYKIFMDF